MAEVSNHPERNSYGETDPLVSFTSNAVLAYDGSGKARGEFGAINGPPINRLPHELFVAVFELYVGADTPVQNLVTLMLVCKLWRNIVEGTPSLWRRISGREGLSAVRKALSIARDVSLEIKYREDSAEMDVKTFFAQINDRVAQWKSLVINLAAASFDSPLAVLRTTAGLKLQTLHLIGRWDREWEGA
ncbi:hypothetical protein FRC05_003825 [Tulasnella sp. 425]|nr:hypothetical protein FRC05_003825 [Tulasnella sp. 425]